MSSFKLGFSNVVGASALALMLFSAPSAFAAGCFELGAALPADKLADFFKNPQTALDSSSNGRLGLSSFVRSVAGTESTAVPLLLTFAANASAAQKAAVGTGLARAAAACVVKSPQFAAEIQTLVAQSGDAILIQAFTSTINDPQTAALTGGDTQGTGATNGGNQGQNITNQNNPNDTGGTGSSGDNTGSTSRGSMYSSTTTSFASP